MGGLTWQTCKWATWSDWDQARSSGNLQRVQQLHEIRIQDAVKGRSGRTSLLRSLLSTQDLVG
eukprot:9232385-Prorocentrum_lima.AAC.1